MTKGEQTRSYIIEKAAPLFNIKGMAATAMSDIMEATGLSKGTIYIHFQDKQALITEAVGHNLKMYAMKIEMALQRHTTAKDKLFAFIDLLSTPLKPVIEGGCPILNFATEADDTDPLIKDTIGRAVDWFEKKIIQIIKAGIKNGEFNADWNYREFATVMFAMLEGGHVACRVSNSNQKMKPIAAILKKMILAEVV